MNSVLLQAATRLLVPVQIVCAIYFFLRGHNDPGGGFIAGLIAASALTLHMLAYDKEETRRLLRMDPVVLMGFGWLLSFCGGLTGMVVGKPFMTSVVFGKITLPFVGKVLLGSVFMFDLGVMVLVTGMVLKVVFLLDEVKE